MNTLDSMPLKSNGRQEALKSFRDTSYIYEVTL